MSKMADILKKLKFEIRLVAGNGTWSPKFAQRKSGILYCYQKIFYLLQQKIGDFIQKITPAKGLLFFRGDKIVVS